MGRTNTLAEALEHDWRTLSARALAQIVARLLVYAISDQDDSGPWLRREFLDLFYIVSPSTPDGSDYARATWTGISGGERAEATLTACATCSPNWLAIGNCLAQGEGHVILAVTDIGKPALTRYRRPIVTVTQPGKISP